MNNDKTSNQSLAPTQSSDNSSAIVSQESQAAHTNSNKSNASSQMQLLNLAKKYVIDGSLLADDKQITIEERAIKRERISHLRQQQNIEHIIQKAVQYCSDSEVTDRVDQDWFTRFIGFAEDVSNKTMQDLWAKILAREVSSPGCFSYKSLKAFKTMSINEAKLLSKASALSVIDSNRKSRRIISGASQTPGLFNFFSKNREYKVNLSPFGLTYADLLTLSDNHLIFLQETETTPLAKGEQLHFSYNGKNMVLSASKNNCLISFYKFTPVGSELAQLIGDNPDNKYLSALKQGLIGLFDIQNK